LYSVLSKLNTPGVNISTIEDPVEYRIPGVNQTQTNPKAGMTFANGLRALLRQDPNIIMIGEIRDGETASLAVQAALTGHLVFATLHTNNAATAIPRLLDMGAEPFLIASTLQVVIGQRLVRRLDTEARESYKPDGKELRNIQETFEIKEAIDKAKQAQKIHEETQAKLAKENKENKGSNKVITPLEAEIDDESIVEKLKSDPNMVDRSAEEAAAKQAAKQEKKHKAEGKEVVEDDIPSSSSGLHLWRVKEDYEGSGYHGRVGIYEVLRVSEEIQKLISSSATAADIQRRAVDEGMMTMNQDGFVKVLQGLTTIEEIMRVTRE
jgi:type II secretory ATPase GspE/PulE/Tfp pilus assembly ATPase PilB-like protein